MAKASGAGIAQVADSVDRVAEGPKEGFWQAMISGTAWWLAHTTPVSGLGVAVALRDFKVGKSLAVRAHILTLL
jgi:hypothetical protein